MAMASVQFPDSKPYKGPPLTPKYKIYFKENDTTILEGTLGEIPTRWGNNDFLMFYPIAVEVADKLFTFETNKVVKEMNPDDNSFMFCWFDYDRNGHANAGASFREEDLNEDRVLEIVFEKLKERKQLMPHAVMEKGDFS